MAYSAGTEPCVLSSATQGSIPAVWAPPDSYHQVSEGRSQRRALKLSSVEAGAFFFLNLKSRYLQKGETDIFIHWFTP